MKWYGFQRAVVMPLLGLVTFASSVQSEVIIKTELRTVRLEATQNTFGFPPIQAAEEDFAPAPGLWDRTLERHFPREGINPGFDGIASNRAITSTIEEHAQTGTYFAFGRLGSFVGLDVFDPGFPTSADVLAVSAYAVQFSIADGPAMVNLAALFTAEDDIGAIGNYTSDAFGGVILERGEETLYEMVSRRFEDSFERHELLQPGEYTLFVEAVSTADGVEDALVGATSTVEFTIEVIPVPEPNATALGVAATMTLLWLKGKKKWVRSSPELSIRMTDCPR